MRLRLQERGLTKFDGVDLGIGRLSHPIALNLKQHLTFEKLLQAWDAIAGRTVKIPLDSRAIILPDARLSKL
jgi:hypothetical protein